MDKFQFMAPGGPAPNFVLTKDSPTVTRTSHRCRSPQTLYTQLPWLQGTDKAAFRSEANDTKDEQSAEVLKRPSPVLQEGIPPQTTRSEPEERQVQYSNHDRGVTHSTSALKTSSPRLRAGNVRNCPAENLIRSVRGNCKTPFNQEKKKLLA